MTYKHYRTTLRKLLDRECKKRESREERGVGVSSRSYTITMSNGEKEVYSYLRRAIQDEMSSLGELYQEINPLITRAGGQIRKT